jgi:hypothetical protein
VRFPTPFLFPGLFGGRRTSLDSARRRAVAEKETSSCAGRMWVVSTYIRHEEDAP